MAINYQVSTKFSAVDKMSAVFAHMEKSGAKFGRGMVQEVDKAKSSLLGFKSVFTGIMASKVVTGALGALRNQVGQVKDEFLSFENSLVSTASRMDITKNSPDYNKLEQSIRSIGGTTEFTNTQVASSFEVLGQAGFKNIEIAEQAARSSADLATIARTDLPKATMISADALASFGLKTQDVSKNVQNLTRINNAFSRATDASTIGIQELYETMHYSAATIKQTKDPLAVETFAALAAIVGSAGVKGSMAGTAIQQSFLRLANPVGKAERLLRKFNIQIEDEQGNMRDQMLIMADLANATKDLGSRQRLSVLAQIFDTRALKGIAPVLDLGSEKILEFRDKIIMTGKDSATKAEEMRKSIQNQLAVLESTKIEFGFKLLDAIRPQLPGILDSITKFISGINVKKIIDGVVAFYDTLVKVYDVLDSLSPYIKALGMVWAVTKVIAFGQAIIGVIASVKLLGIAAATGLGPFYLMVFGISAAVFSIIKYWDELVTSIEEASDIIVNKFYSIFGSLAKWIISLVTDSWFGTVLEKLGLMDRKAMEALNRNIDKLTEPKTISMNIRTNVLGPQIAPTVSQEETYADIASRGMNAYSIDKTYNVLGSPDIAEPTISKASRSGGQSSPVSGSWEGTLNIPNAPKGSSVTTNKSHNAPPLNINLGQN